MRPVNMSRVNEVVFLSQGWAEAYLPEPGEAVISITDRGSPQADLNPGWAASLRICFDDLDPVESPAEPGEDLVELQIEQARQIAEFVHRCAPEVTTIVVHCKYGQSRSAGVAKAIAMHYGLRFPKKYKYANNHVYRLVLESLRKHERA